MSYTTLNALNDSFSSAVNSTAGLNSYLMIDLSELNAHHNINYPICIIEPPNSSIGNINKGWEDYSASCYVLQVDDSNVSNVSQYDTCLSLFTEFLARLMKQREGDYALDKESVSIERVRGQGNDNLIGVFVEFNLLVPSVISSNAADLILNTNGLYGYWSGDSGVTADSLTLSWASEEGSPQRSFVHSGETGQDIPAHDRNMGAFVFQGFSGIGKAESILLNNVNFTTANHSIFFRLKLPRSVSSEEQVLFEFPSDAEGDFHRAVVIKGGTHDGKFKITVGSTDDFSFSKDSLPIGTRAQYDVVGFVNDADRGATYISVNNQILTSSNYRSDVVQNTDLHVGARHLDGYGDMNGFLGTISHIAIYDKALTNEEHLSTISKMKSEH
jgi:hypothetical protein